MTGLRDLDRAEVVRAAEAALSRTTGDAVAIRDAETLSGQERRNLILRGRLSGAGRSVIVKATRAGDYDATSPNAFEAFGLVKEWAAPAFLAARAPAGRHGARLLAGDAGRGILVFEDIGAGSGSLVEPLRDGGPEAAEGALIAYAVALGRAARRHGGMHRRACAGPARGIPDGPAAATAASGAAGAAGGRDPRAGRRMRAGR